MAAGLEEQVVDPPLALASARARRGRRGRLERSGTRLGRGELATARWAKDLVEDTSKPQRPDSTAGVLVANK